MFHAKEPLKGRLLNLSSQLSKNSFTIYVSHIQTPFCKSSSPSGAETNLTALYLQKS